MILYEIISNYGAFKNTTPFVYRVDAVHFLRQRGYDPRMIHERIAKEGDYCRDGNKIYRVNEIGKHPVLLKVGLYYPDNENYLK